MLKKVHQPKVKIWKYLLIIKKKLSVNSNQKKSNNNQKYNIQSVSLNKKMFL